MTGSMQVLMAGSIPITPFALVLKSTASGVATCRLDMLTDGSITTSGTGNQSTCVPPNWALPLNAANGTNFWVQMTINSGTAPTTGTVGVRQSLGLSPLWSWGRTGVGVTSANITIDIYSASSGGGPVFSITTTMTITVT